MALGRATGLRVVFAGLCGALALVLGPLVTASAEVGAAAPSHADVLSVTPADGSRLERAPAAIVVVLDEDVNPAFVQVTLTSSGTAVPLAAPTVSGGTVTVPVPPGSAQAPGSYRVAFRVVSSDGHPVSGSSAFTVTGTPAAAPGAAPPTTPPPATGAGASGASSPAAAAGQPVASAASGPASGMPVAVALVALLVVGAGGLLLFQRRRAR